MVPYAMDANIYLGRNPILYKLEGTVLSKNKCLKILCLYIAMDTPTYLDAPKRIIVIGDIHGDIGILCSCLYMANIINHKFEWIAQPADTIVVQMGDQVDSLSRDANQPWEKIDDMTLLQFTDRLDEIARKKGGRFISLLGNHEVMNVLGQFDYVSPLSMQKAGGIQGRRERFQPGGSCAKILAKRNVVQKIGGLLFCHAGLLPHHLQLIDGQLPLINLLMKRYLSRDMQNDNGLALFHSLFVDEMSILWNRFYLEQMGPNAEQVLNDVLKHTNSTQMIIGHNPLQNITTFYNFKLWVTDIGLSRAFSNEGLEVLEILNGGIPSETNNHQPFRVIRAIKK